MFERLSVLLCAAVVLVLAGCSARSDPNPPLRFGMAAAPITFDPRYATDAASTRIDRLLYRRLVGFDASFHPVPALARWERLSPTRYRFVLGAQGRRFTNGSRLTAQDVKATYDSVLDPATGSPARGDLAKWIERIEVVDENTVDFILKRPDALFPGRLTLGILPKSLIDSHHAFNSDPIGSGPFVFVSWPDEGRLLLRRRSDGRVFEFLRIKDPTVRVLKLLRGEVDMLQGDLPPELVSWLRKRPGIKVQTELGTTFAYLGFNMQDPVVGQLAVRRAIAYAIDRKAIIRYVMGGAAQPANALLPPDHWAGNPHLKPIPYDPSKARALLHELGYGPHHPLHITYKTSSDPYRVRLATIIQDELAQVGIDADIRSYDWGTFYGDIKAGRFQMYSLAWVGIKMPDIFHYVFDSDSVPPAGANRGRFINARADQLIAEAEAAQTLPAQAVYYRELEALLLRKLPYVPLWYEDNVYVARADIEGYKLARDGNYDALEYVRRVREK